MVNIRGLCRLSYMAAFRACIHLMTQKVHYYCDKVFLKYNLFTYRCEQFTHFVWQFNSVDLAVKCKVCFLGVGLFLL